MQCFKCCNRVSVLRLVFAIYAFSWLVASNSKSQELLESSTWPAASVERTALPKERAFSYAFKDVQTASLEKLLKMARVELPVKIEGKLSGWLWVQRATTGWFRFSDYRLEGEITSPLLSIDQWQISQSKLRFGYVNRAWYVSKLAGNVRTPVNQQSVGRAEVAAVLNKAESQLLEISGTFTDATLQPFLDQFGLKFKVENQPGTVALSGSVPWRSVDQPVMWKATGRLNLPGVKVKGAPSGTLTTTAMLNEGTWTIVGGNVSIGGQNLTINGQGKVVDPLPYSITVAGSQLDMIKLLNDFDLPQLARQIDGEIRVEAKISGNATDGLQSALLDIVSKKLMIDGETINDLHLAAALPKDPKSQPIIINLESARIAGGTVDGNVVWPSLAELNETPQLVDLHLKNLSLTQLKHLQMPFTMDGVASGTINLQSRKGPNGIDWGTTSQLTIIGLTSSNSPPGTFELKAIKDAASRDLQLTLQGEKQSLHAEIVVHLKAPAQAETLAIELDSFTARGSLQHFSTSIELNSVASPVSIDATGSFDVQGDATNWLISGSADLRNVNLVLAERPIEIETAVVTILPDALRVERFRMSDPSGRIAGSALIQRQNEGEHLLNVRVVDIDVARYIVAFASPDFHGAKGLVSLEARLRKKANEKDLMSGWQGRLTGTLSDLQYRGMPIGGLAIVASIIDETLHLEIDGDALGGSAHATIEFPNISKSVQSFPNLSEKILDGTDFVSVRGSLHRIQLKRLLSLYYGPQTGGSYDGVASLDLSNVLPNGDRGWSARLDVPSLYLERHSIAKTLAVQVRYLNGILVIDQLMGGFAGGRIEAAGEIQLASSDIGGLARFHAEKLQLGSLVALLYPKYASHFNGELTYRGRLQSDHQISLSGHARLVNAIAYDLPIEDAHGELRVILSKLGSLHAIESSSVTGTALGGRLHARVKIRGGARYELASTLKIDEGRLDDLSRALGFQKILGTGKFNAGAQIHSEDFFDLGALTGPVRFRFEKADAQSAPLISDLARLAPLTQFASTNIQNGTMDAQLGQGQLRIRHFLIYSDAFTLAAQGYAGLTSRRLDLEAILQNGGGIKQQLTQSATQNLLAISLPELFIISEINDLIRNRAVYFHVGGTTQHPSIQPRPVSTLAKALIQNIERQLLLPNVQSLLLPGN